MKLQHSTIKFELEGEIKTFDVYHNLNDFGLSIQAALDNWLPRTYKFTEKSFCKYVMRKDQQIVCLTESQAKRLQRYGNRT